MNDGIYIVYQQFIVMYDSGCQICCNWSRLNPVFKVPAADKHETPSSHLKLTLGHRALF